MPKTPNRCRLAPHAARPIGVDREAKVIRGMVVAQAGPFKSEGRGEFDLTALDQIRAAWPKAGLRSRFAHPNESSDGLGKYLGRARDPFPSTVLIEVDGKAVEVPAVRADLHLDPTAFGTPNGDLGTYVMDLAANDPGAISSSLVLRKSEEWRLTKDGTPQLGADGRELPPLWRVEKLFATDVVDEGDAVDGILSPESPRWTRDYLSRGEALLNELFAGQSRAVVKARLRAYLTRYLERRYGGRSMNQQLGPALGGTLDGYITEATTDERPREVILSEMAQESGLDVAVVSQIVAGASDEGVTVPVLEAFAKVLACPFSELVVAAEEDGIDLAGGAEPAPTEPAPTDPAPAEPAPMSKPGVMRRRLELKAKAGR
jgi:hypothetical protein